MKMPNRRVRPITVPTTSMGDIAFLLIIFFMLTSNFMKQKNIELDKPAGPDVEQVEKAPVSVALDKDGLLWVQGAEVPINGLSGELAALRSEGGERPVHVTIDKSARKEAFMPVMQGGGDDE